MVQVKLLVIVLCVGGLKCCEVLRLLDFAADELWRVSWSLEATSMLPQHPTGLPVTDFSLSLSLNQFHFMVLTAFKL